MQCFIYSYGLLNFGGWHFEGERSERKVVPVTFYEPVGPFLDSVMLNEALNKNRLGIHILLNLPPCRCLSFLQFVKYTSFNYIVNF